MSDSLSFALHGGLNLAGLTLGLKRGEATLIENYIPLELGGYRRFAGFERYDGHPEPHDATYSLIPFTGGLVAAVSLGDTVTGATSGATGRVLEVEVTSGAFATDDAAGNLVVDRVTGTFNTTENLTVGGTTRAFKSAVTEAGGPLDDKYDARLALASDGARSLINPPPGEGSIRGVAILNGVVYAFKNAVGGASCVMHKATASGWTPAKTGLAPGGSYEFVEHNFKGAASTRALYGVSGVHKAFQWNGTTWTDITTGMTVDTPKRIAEHKNYLWLAYTNGSLQNSPVGDPTATWTLRTGSIEFGIGDEITALLSTRGGVMGVYCVSSIKLLYGSSVVDWDLRRHSDKQGAYPRSVQDSPMGAVGIDKMGLSPLAVSQAFGDFETATISQRVKPFLDARRGHLVASVSLASGSQYRAFFDDGSVLVLVFDGQNMAGYSVLRLPFVPSCAYVGRDADDEEMLIVGGSDGHVYRLDVGMSMDGEPVDCVIRTAPDDCKNPRRLKQFLKLSLQVSTQRPLTLRVQPEFDYALSQADISQATAIGTSFSANSWDIGTWDEMTWDTGYERDAIAYPELPIDGRAKAVSFVIYHGGEIRPPFTIESGILSFRDGGVAR